MHTPGERFDRASGSSPLRTERAYYDPREIVITPGWNGRDMTSPDTRDHIATLEQSILADGVRYPIKVSYDKKTGVKTLIAGQCRLTACLNLRKQGHKILVPCERVDGDEIELTIENLTSNAGLPLTQWECGVEYRKLLRWGQNAHDIARRVCKPVRYVNEAIALSNVPVEAKEMLREGSVTPGAVLHAVSGKDGDSLPKLKERVAAAPKPAQTSIPGTAKPPKPVARPKKPSAAEQTAKSAPSLLELADAMYRLIVDEQPWAELELAAKAYGKARGL